MNQEEQGRIIRRILVALDASPSSLAALEAAAELAASSGAELIGLFVEDVNLVRLTEISFTQEVGLFSTRTRRLDILTVERQLRAQAGRVRQALETISERLQVSWTFRVIRGVVTTELLSAAKDVDLVILGRGSWPPRSSRRLGSTARTVLTQTPRLALLLQHGIRLGLPVLVVYDGSTVTRKALRVTTQLMAGKRNGLVTVLILADGPEAARRLREEAASELTGPGLEARYLWETGADVRKLIHTIHTEGCRLLVLSTDGSSLDREALLELLDRIECPVLLVR